MNRATSFLGMLAVIAIAVVFVVSFGPGGGQNQAKAGPDCAAEVLGNCVKASHYWATYRIYSQGRESQDQAKQMKEDVLNGLIERELLLADAKRLGVSVSEDELSKELFAGRIRFSLPYKAIEARQQATPVANYRTMFLDKKTKSFSADQYKKIVTDITHLSEPEFREYQRSELIAARMRELIMSRVRISESEAFEEFSSEQSAAKVKSVRLRPRFYAARAVDLSQEAIDAWATKNVAEVDKVFEERKKGLKDGCREVSQIQLNFRGPMSEDDKKAVKAKLEDAKKRVEDGASFASVARELSEDPISRRDGGRMGCALQGQMAGPLKPLEDAIFGVKEAGALTDVVVLPEGMHLLRIDKIHTGADAEKALRETTARQAYVAAEAQRLAAEAGKQIQAAVKGGKTLEEALQAHLDALPKELAPPAPDAPKPGGDPKKDDAPKKDPKKDDAPKDGDAPKDPKKDDAPKDGDAPRDGEVPKKDAGALPVDPSAPVIETSRSFTMVEEPFMDAAQGESAAAAAFALTKPGEVAERLIPLQRGEGFIVMVLVEKTKPSDEDWTKARDDAMSKLRQMKQIEALTQYLRRLKTTHQAEVKPNPELLPKTGSSADPEGTNAPAP